MITVGELNGMLCDLHRAETETHRNPDQVEAARYKGTVPELKEAILCAYEDALDELARLQRVSAWSRQ